MLDVERFAINEMALMALFDRSHISCQCWAYCSIATVSPSCTAADIHCITTSWIRRFTHYHEQNNHSAQIHTCTAV